MGKIRTALEIAMERTDDIEVNKESILINERKKDGMKFASKLMRNEISPKEVKKQIKDYSEKETNAVMDGINVVLLANITLSETAINEEHYLRIGDIFFGLGKTGAKELTAELIKFIKQYQENLLTLRDNLAEQFKPIIAQKEAEVTQKTGSPVKLQPEQIPEFKKALQDNFTKMRAQYDEALSQAKKDLALK